MVPRALSFVAFLLAVALPSVAQPCGFLSVPSFTFTPPGNVGVDESYTLAWSDTTPGVDDFFVVERSTISSFSTILDSQQVLEPAASFLVSAEGRYYHRVRAVPACDPTRASPNSGTASVNVVAGAASVVVTLQPKPIITTLGEALSGKTGTIVLENVTKRPVTVLITEREIGDSPSFFRVSDPEGGNLLNLTLEPATPKTLDISVSGFGTPENVRRSFQGVILITGSELAVIPYAFVNLKIGGSESAAPFFRRDGLPVEYAFFPGFSGSDDGGRVPITVDIVNPGSSPVEVGGEVGPEIWLEPESGWNESPIAAGGSITVDLFTKRERALTGSPLPRYTYFTTHTRNGESARLLVQDNDAVTAAGGRAQLAQADTSAIVPGVRSEILSNGRRFYSILTIANLGTTDVNAELYYTPDTRDGFSAAVRRVSLIVPGNDIVRLTDPLSQLFGAPLPAQGQIEIRAPQGQIRFLNLSARTFAPAADGIGGFGYRLPVLIRGEGARDDTPHTITGITVGSSEISELLLTETTGVDDASVRLELLDASGASLGFRNTTVSRYGQMHLADLMTSFSRSAPIVGARLVLTIPSGKGSIAGTVVVRDASYRGWILVSQPSSGPLSGLAAARGAARLAWPERMFVRQRRAAGQSFHESVQYLISNVLSGSGGPIPGNLSTAVGITAPAEGSLSVTLTLVDAGGVQRAQTTVNVGAGQTTEFANVVRELFNLQGSFRGMILADSSRLGGLIHARVTSTSGAVTTTLALPVIVTSSPALTGGAAGERRPVYIDGVEQSTSSQRGSKWALVMNEVSNGPLMVEVRLYEAGNRVVPIARKQFQLGSFQEQRLDSVFAAMDLESELRNKDRLNVLVAVVPVSGEGLVSAVALATDNRTGAITTYRLTPSGGIPATSILLANPIPLVPVEESPNRRRAVRRP